MHARIAEESKDPGRVIPKAIANATTFTYIIGFLFNLTLVLCMGDPLDLIDSPSGQPVSDRPPYVVTLHRDRVANHPSIQVAQLFFNAMGRGPAILFTLCGFLMMNLVAIPGIQAGSRTVFSLARDDLLPFSSVLRRISKRTQTAPTQTRCKRDATRAKFHRGAS